MKVAGRESARFCGDPPGHVVGALLTGEDSGLVAARRQALVTALTGGEDAMRVTGIDAADARRDPARIDEAMRAIGFFPGRQVVVIEGGTDGLARGLGAIIGGGITPEDAFLVVTAGVLTGRSALRKLFEGSRSLACVNCEALTPGPDDAVRELRARGLAADVTADAAAALSGIAAGMDYGSFSRFLDVLALYAAGRSEPLDEAAVLALVPAGLAGDVDRFVAAVAEGEPARLAPMIRRLRAGGATPVGLLLALQRHFRALLSAASGEGGAERGVARLRPPAFGRRRDALLRQLRIWRRDRLEQACRVLLEADATVRSSGAPPEFAVLERASLRLAIMARR